MLSLTQPSEPSIANFLEQQAELKLSYAEVGCSKQESFTDAKQLGYDTDRVESLIGHGDQVYQRARDLLHRWKQFQVGWVEVVPDDTPITNGRNVAVRAKVLGCWALATTRILSVTEESSETEKRFGFSIGTLPGHPMRGEERFEIRQSPDGSVSYEIIAHFKPNWWSAKIGWPYFRYRANGFRRQSVKQMIRLAA